MPRNPNTDQTGGTWPDRLKLAVWNKGLKVVGNDPNHSRVDIAGFLMEFHQYGNRKSNEGWEIDHIVPVANGGTDDIANLQPLNWQNNAEKGDHPNWKPTLY